MCDVKNDEEQYLEALDELVDDILLWPLIMACSIVCRFPDAPFKQEYIIPQMLYELCSSVTGFHGVRYYSTKLDVNNRKQLESAMINYALPAQDVKVSGYCPYLSNLIQLTKPITAENCGNIKIESKYKGYTSFGLPIISEKCGHLKNDNIVLALDKMTVYFDNLITKSPNELSTIEK